MTEMFISLRMLDFPCRSTKNEEIPPALACFKCTGGFSQSTSVLLPLRFPVAAAASASSSPGIAVFQLQGEFPHGTGCF